jgi:hypothetical protein
MKKIILMFVLSIIFSKYLFSQHILITKQSDTIYCEKIEFKYPNWQYWTKESEKPIKIKNIDLQAIVDFPAYEIEETTKDDFTGNTHVITKSVTFGNSVDNNKSKLDFWISKVSVKDEISKYVIVLIPNSNIGCSGAKGNYVIFKFSNDEILRIENDRSKIDCSGGFASMYEIEGNNYDLLLHNEIKAIRLKQSESFKDYYTFFPDCIIQSLLILK